MSTKVPQWLSPAIGGGIVGAIAIATVGFMADWVVTSKDAEKLADQKVEKAVVAALTPICVEQFKKASAAQRTTHLAALEKENIWEQGDYIEEQGWARVPGNDRFSDDVAEACSEQLLKATKKQ